MRTGGTIFVCCCIILAACDNSVGLPTGAHRITPPAQFRAWWQLTEACSGHTGNFNSVAWYVVSNDDSFSLEGETVNGAWYGGTANRIVLGDSELTDGTLVRHEMLHALLQVGTHPRDQFLGNCGDIVVCVAECVSGAGGPPDTSDAAPLLGPAVLTAATLIVPDTLSVSSDSGWFTITITITNTTSTPARALVTTYHGMPITIARYTVTPAWSGVYAYQFDNYLTFAPADSVGATRRIVFDHQLTTPAQFDTYTITGYIAESAAPPQTLLATP